MRLLLALAFALLLVAVLADAQIGGRPGVSGGPNASGGGIGGGSGPGPGDGIGSGDSSASVILLIGDDIGVSELDVYMRARGGSRTSTPNIDTIASEGITFTNAMTSQICGPTKYQLLFGMNDWRVAPQAQAGTTPSNLVRLLGSRPSGGFGKLSMTCDGAAPGSCTSERSTYGDEIDPIMYGFNHFELMTTGPAFPAGDNNGEYEWSIVDGLASYTTEPQTAFPMTYLQDYITTRANTWIADQGGIFFAWIHHHQAHSVFHSPAASATWNDVSPGTNCTGPPADLYACIIEQVDDWDDQIGAIYAAADLTNTWIIVTSDDGTDDTDGTGVPVLPGSDGCKNNPDDCGSRIPLIIRPPDGFAPASLLGTSLEDLVHHRDLTATIAAIMGVTIHELDGVDLTPRIRGTCTTQDCASGGRRWVFDRSGRTPNLEHTKLWDSRSNAQYVIESAGDTNERVHLRPDQVGTTDNASAGVADLKKVMAFQADAKEFEINVWNNGLAPGFAQTYSGCPPEATVCEPFEQAWLFGNCEDTYTVDACCLDGDCSASACPLAQCANATPAPVGRFGASLDNNIGKVELRWDIECDSLECTASWVGRFVSISAGIARKHALFWDGAVERCGLNISATTIRAVVDDSGTVVSDTISETLDLETNYEFELKYTLASNDCRATVWDSGRDTQLGQATATSTGETSIASFQLQNGNSQYDVRVDEFVYVEKTFEPVAAGDFDCAVDGIGYDDCWTFEENDSCTNLGFTLGGGAEVDADDCRVTPGLDGDRMAYLTASGYIYASSVCLDTETVQVDYEFQRDGVAATGEHIAFWSAGALQPTCTVIDSAGTGNIRLNGEGFLITALLPVTFSPTTSVTYRGRLEADKANDTCRIWIDPAEGAHGAGGVAYLEMAGSGWGTTDGDELWLSNTGSDFVADNVRWRCVPSLSH